ncbi:MAG: histidine--tRNA ligase [Parcubacteria group bacterium]|nr:histidine--tRNA ligase [Parcubacteria group bacterium]
MTNESGKRNKLSTEPYKGVRDFYPADQAIQDYIFGKMRKTVESFGYVEYGASLLESTELYEAKSGEELINEQTYSFKDRGDRNVTLRPEMTPTVARMIASKRRELSFPARWYSIPNAFRYERPQRGRVREHWQLNADLFGAEGVEADAEIISLASQILKDMDAKDTDFEIRVNFAGILIQYLKEKFNLDDTNAEKLVKVIDRYSKISEEDFEKRAKEILEDKTSELLDILNKKDIKEFNNYEEIKYLEELKDKLNVEITIDPFLTRGFDYYTGMVFEVYDTNPENNRSVFGGGRYDNLLEIFDAEKVPAVGFGMGDVPIKNFLEVRNLIPEYTSTTDLMLCTLSAENITFAQGLATRLREQGLNIALNITDKKIDKQIKTADKQSIPFIICIGEEEEKTGKFKLKELKTGKEEEITEEEIKNLIF